MTEEDVFGFLAGCIPSVWALELLLMLKRAAPEGRREDELVRDLRSSATAVHEAVEKLRNCGLLAEETGLNYYRPASPQIDAFVSEAEKLYAVKPATVIKTIVMSQNQNLRIFADSFKLKE